MKCGSSFQKYRKLSCNIVNSLGKLSGLTVWLMIYKPVYWLEVTTLTSIVL